MPNAIEETAKKDKNATFWGNSIGVKAAMSISGILLGLFLLEHIVGNLTVYAGRKVMNGYARALEQPFFVEALWVIRVTLVIAFLIHVVSALVLYFRKWKARPVSYSGRRWVEGSLPSRTMLWSGLVILAYVVYHVLQMALGVLHPSWRGFENVYDNLVLALRNVGTSVIYLVAMVALGFHTWHGFYSLFNSIGYRSRRYTPKMRVTAAVVGTVLALAFASIPIAILAGLGGI
jgi:succinate dehydrogenase / fumarate reductase cytochrome b subunit